MNPTGWALGGLLAALLVAAYWCRPTPDERAALARYPAAARRRLFLPFSSSWLTVVRPDDYVALGALRRRAMISLLAAVAIPAIWWGALRSGPPEQAPPAAPAAGVSERSAPAAEAPAAAHRVVRMPERRGFGAEEPVDSEAPLAEPLEELRSQIRLYGSAKVSAVYEGHDVRGVRVERVKPGSFWDLVGIRNGDVIVELHGDPVDEAGDTVAVMNSLERDSDVRMRVRGLDGEERFIEFDAPE